MKKSTKRPSRAVSATAVEEFDMSEVMGLTVPTSFMYKNRAIHIKVFAEKVTPEFQELLQAANDRSEVEAVRFLLQECVESWSLNWNKKPFPPTPANIKRCPFSFLGACSEAVLQIWQGNAESASKSESTSEQTGS